MKNTGGADNENNAIVVETYNFNDTLTQPKGGQSLLECRPNTPQSKCDILKKTESTPMGHKGRFYYRVLSKNNVTQESRSQSLPNSLDNKNKSSNSNVSENNCCDTQIKLLPENESPPQSPIQELWFNTWPERNEKTKSIDVVNDVGSHPPSPSKVCDNSEHFRSEQTNKSVNNILTLNEALNSISLAYSPVTKQLHYIQKGSENIVPDPSTEPETTKPKLGHRRTEAGSFSSTVSSLSDPSPSGSLLDAEDRVPSPSVENGAKSKKKGLSSFFSRNVFSWRTVPSPTWNLFNKPELELEGSPIHENIVASSSALIQHERPSHLPAKNSEEEQRHRDEYKAMLAAAKRREAKNSFAKHKQQKLQLQVEDQLASAAKYWNTCVLPKWDVMQKTKKTREMWWQGLPSSVRGKIWRLAIGNDLNLTQQLYEICSSRAQNRLNSLDSKSDSSGTTDSCSSGPVDTVDQESSLDVIKLDIARTFPNLCIFQEGGPYSSILHSLLAAYVCYRPDVGYVQGMSFIAAVLILNMELFDAFICFANLLNRPLHLAAYTLNQKQMHAYYAAYNEIFNYNLPKLFAHFEKSGLTPDLYLLDWVYTVFAKAMPLDVACRVWDVFLRDGDEFIFRTALGVLHLHQDILLNMDFLHGAQFLTRLPDDLSAENLFRSIQTISGLPLLNIF